MGVCTTLELTYFFFRFQMSFIVYTRKKKHSFDMRLRHWCSLFLPQLFARTSSPGYRCTNAKGIDHIHIAFIYSLDFSRVHRHTNNHENGSICFGCPRFTVGALLFWEWSRFEYTGCCDIIDCNLSFCSESGKHLLQSLTTDGHSRLAWVTPDFDWWRIATINNNCAQAPSVRLDPITISIFVYINKCV